MIWSFYTSSKQEYRAQKDDPLVSVSNLDIFTYGVSFPQVTFCSEYFYDPGMDPSWFKTANATVYRDLVVEFLAGESVDNLTALSPEELSHVLAR